MFANFPVTRWRIGFYPEKPLHLPDYTGSIWRGVFSKALWDLVCLNKDNTCTACPEVLQCAYPSLFETPGASVAWAGSKRAPGACLIEPDADMPRQIGADTPAWVDFVLLGQAQKHLPLIVEAWRRGLAKGVGTERVRCRLTTVWSLQGADGHPTSCVYSNEQGWCLQGNGLLDIPSSPDDLSTLTIELLTPLRLKRHNDLIGPREFESAFFLTAILRRVLLLAKAHAGMELEVDFRVWGNWAEAITLKHKDLHWQDWTRFSSRQKTAMQMGGVLGSIELSGPLTPFWPLLYVAQWTHIGKGTGFGLGRIRLRSNEKSSANGGA